MEQIKFMEEKMKNFDRIYQSFPAKYIGGVSTELTSNILVIISFVLKFPFS